MRPRPKPPKPNSIRRPTSGFGWLDARMLRDGWLAELGPDGVAVLAFLAIAADRDGVSYYARDRVAVQLDLDLPRVDRALRKLQDAGLLAHRPWRAGRRDGVWQLLPVPDSPDDAHASRTLSAAQVLCRLGFAG